MPREAHCRSALPGKAAASPWLRSAFASSGAHFFRNRQKPNDGHAPGCSESRCLTESRIRGTTEGSPNMYVIGELLGAKNASRNLHDIPGK
jgi:hypothetical protein